MSTLKQCLHFDPDSKPCLVLHRLQKKLDKMFAQLEELIAKEDWRGIVKLVVSPGGAKNGDLWNKWEEAMNDNMTEDKIFPLVPPELIKSYGKTKKLPRIPMPNAAKSSPQRQHLVRTVCKAYTNLASAAPSSSTYAKQTTHWCELLLTLNSCSEDVDGMVGKSIGLMAAHEYEEAVRVLEKAFEVGGRSDAKVMQRLNEARRRLKVSKQKDYYKILGVDKSADAKTIKKA